MSQPVLSVLRGRSSVLFRHAVLAVALCGSVQVATASTTVDQLSNCLVKSTTATDKTTVLQWTFAALAAHPDLAGPLVIILIVQTIVLALYTSFVTFKVMGSDYDAAVLAAGHCGFGMGATPTAIANIQAVTNTYGPSHKAFLIIPLCGAFFIDIINAVVIQTIIKFI